MTDPHATKKPGLFRRLFGKGEAQPAPQPGAPSPDPADWQDHAHSHDPAALQWWEELARQDAIAGSQLMFAQELEQPPLPESPIPESTAEERAPVASPVPESPVSASPAPESPAPVSAPQAAAPASSVPVPVAPTPAQTAPAPTAPAPRKSWWQRLKSGLTRTSSQLSRGISDIFTKRKLDGATLEDLEDLLIQSDLGLPMAARIASAVGKGRYDKNIDPDTVKTILADEIEKVLQPVAQPLTLSSHRPHVILVVGVNGSGKTTTIGKLGSIYAAQGKSIVLAAGDTFRAAAIEQLKIWGSRIGAEVVARDQGSDAAGLAFDALKAARDKNADILMMDTAGRLQNRKELMDELEKIVRVMKKLDPTAPHSVLLVLDATVGQNALSQVEIFGRTAGVTGLVMTKLDGTARGGILAAIAEKYALPVHFIGVGETIDDIEPFKARDFARAIAGLEQEGH